MTVKKREKKKLSLPLRILMVGIVLVAIFLCSAVLFDSDDTPIGNSDTTDSADVVNSAEEPTANTDDSALVDNDKIKVSFVGAEDASDLGVFYVTLKIENKTDNVITINLENADVDGETIPLITTGVPLVVQPGNSGQTAFIFSMVNLSISTMDEAEEASFRVIARDNGSFETVYTSELITVELH